MRWTQRNRAAAVIPNPTHPYRNAYARDRDRIIHSRAFRRLEAKTQVFTTRYSDHFRNRLTHTLEVAQIARTVAGALGLDADLAEALALGHDIGHPPFGHAGEHKLDDLAAPARRPLRSQSPRAAHRRALRAPLSRFPGLNLTFEVREGIVKHSRDYDTEHPALAEYLLDLRPPLEAQLIDLVDEIAYDTSDLDDGYEAHVLDIEMICAEVPLFARFYEQVERSHPHGAVKLKFNEAAKRVLNYLATGMMRDARSVLAASGVQTVEDVRHAPRRLAGFSASMAAENATLKKFLHVRLYNNPAIVGDRERSVEALSQLFAYYV